MPLFIEINRVNRKHQALVKTITEVVGTLPVIGFNTKTFMASAANSYETKLNEACVHVM
jgi:hypothetical protein